MASMSEFNNKVSALAKLMGGSTPQAVADFYDCSIEEIEEIDANRFNIMEVAHFHYLSLHMDWRGGNYPRMENILYCWLAQQTTNITNNALAEKAKQIIGVINERPFARNVPVFSGTYNWVNGFKKRYGILTRQNRNSNPEPEELTEDSLATNDNDDDSSADNNAAGQIGQSVDDEQEKDPGTDTEVEFKAEPEKLQSQVNEYWNER